MSGRSCGQCRKHHSKDLQQPDDRDQLAALWKSLEGLDEPHRLPEGVTVWETWQCSLCGSYTWDESGPKREHLGRFTWHEEQPRVTPISALAFGNDPG
jgi:hypothetical protein